MNLSTATKSRHTPLSNADLFHCVEVILFPLNCKFGKILYDSNWISSKQHHGNW